MKQYLTERSMLFNDWSEFFCPDGCERRGCKEPELHISISLVDLIAIAWISGRKIFDLFRIDCKVGFDPIREGEPWLGRLSIELKNPASFLMERNVLFIQEGPLPVLSSRNTIFLWGIKSPF